MELRGAAILSHIASTANHAGERPCSLWPLFGAGDGALAAAEAGRGRGRFASGVILSGRFGRWRSRRELLLHPGQGGHGYPPRTGFRPPPPMWLGRPAKRYGERPRGEPGVGRFFPLSAKPAHHRYQYEPGHACCALLEAVRQRAGRSRFARSAVTPCPRRESKSRPSSPHTAGSSADRRLLSARGKRDCTTQNEEET